MILTFDIANMTTLIGGFVDQKLRFTCRCASDRTRTEDEYVLLIRDLLNMYDVNWAEVEGSILSSVVPSPAYHHMPGGRAADREACTCGRSGAEKRPEHPH